MFNKKLEKRLYQAFSNAAPDIKSTVIIDSAEQKDVRIVPMYTNNIRPLWSRFAAMAAAFAIMVSSAGLYLYHSEKAVAAAVQLDVNPSIEIKLNQKERVIELTPLNEDGAAVIGDMDFKGSSLELTVNALIGSMLRKGYLSELANSILVSVNSKDHAKEAELQERLSKEISGLISSPGFEAAVLTQSVAEDETLKAKADEYGITQGKAQLVEEIAAQKESYSFEALAPLSINELNLLRKQAPGEDAIHVTGRSSDKAYIGVDAAKLAALRHAGLSEADIYGFEAELDFENGRMVYELEFRAGNMSYDYEIDALSGAVIKYETEFEGAGQAPATVQKDGGRDNSGSASGQLPPAAAGGSPAAPPAQGSAGSPAQSSPGSAAQGSAGQAQSQTLIGEGSAKKIALDHAGLSEGSVQGLRCKLDREDGIQVYELEFRYQGWSYEYEIDASSGAVIKWEKDND